MENREIQKLLMQELPLEAVYVTSEDGSHFQIIAIGEIFHKLSRIKKQQVIYQPLMQYITNKSIHALSIKTYTPEEWINYNKFNTF